MPNEISVVFKGGLGNQLFQLAFLMYLVEKGNSVLMNTSIFQKVQFHEGFVLIDLLDLEKLNVIKSNDDLFDIFYAVSNTLRYKFLKRGVFLLKKMWVFTNALYGRIPKCNISDKDLFLISGISKLFNRDLLLNSNNTFYLDGYWQDLTYAERARNLIKESLITSSQNEEVNILLKVINKCESVAIHFRGGDFQLIDQYNILTKKYYKEAVDFILSTSINPIFFLFYDDYDFMKQLLPDNLINVIDVSSSRFKATDDFLLMHNCSKFIISNSTFSWWAAYLAKPNITVSPSQYGYELKGNNLLDLSWKVIDL